MKISDLIANKHIKHFIVGGQQYTIGCHAVDQGEVFVEGYLSLDDTLFIVTEDVESNGDIVQANPLDNFIRKDYEISVQFVVDF